MGILDFLFADPAKTTLPSPADALPGRAEPMPVPERHTVLGTPLAGPLPDGAQVAVFGLGCFWGAEKTFWQTPGVVSTAVGYAGGITPNPTYEEVCSGRTGPRRGRPGRVRPGARLVRGAAAHLLGAPRPDAGDAPGQRRRHAVPVGRSTSATPTSGRPPRRRATRTRRSWPGGLRDDHDGDRRRAARSTTPRTTTSSTSTRTRTATARTTGRAWRARSGSGSSAPPTRRRGGFAASNTSASRSATPALPQSAARKASTRLGEQGRRARVVQRQARVGEQVLVARVEEQLGLVGRRHERAGSVEVRPPPAKNGSPSMPSGSAREPPSRPLSNRTHRAARTPRAAALRGHPAGIWARLCAGITPSEKPA